jgi:hypothetical protein
MFAIPPVVNLRQLGTYPVFTTACQPACPQLPTLTSASGPLLFESLAPAAGLYLLIPPQAQVPLQVNLPRP